MDFSKITSVTLFTLLSFSVLAQEEDLLSLLGEEETVNYVTASFKTNRVINLHSLENTAAGELDIKISHRFASSKEGFYDLFGLDDANIRIGGDYGISDRLMVGAGRNSLNKVYDAFAKFKLLKQSTGLKKMPVTAAVFASAAITTQDFADSSRVNYFSSRMYYTFQLIIGRKFSNAFSLQLSPTLVHRNLVEMEVEENDVLALGVAARIKLGKRVSLNTEYIYVLPDQLAPKYQNSLSVGFDIETGGHVFQLHFTNSASMVEKGYIAETIDSWGKRQIHFGFNISRVFNIK